MEITFFLFHLYTRVSNQTCVTESVARFYLLSGQTQISSGISFSLRYTVSINKQKKTVTDLTVLPSDIQVGINSISGKYGNGRNQTTIINWFC